jgi:hypothetical protein
MAQGDAGGRTRANEPREVMQRAFDAARTGSDFVLEAVDAGTPVNAQTDKGDTLLMLAAYHGHLSVVRGLLRRGANPELANARGQTPLMGVAFKGDAAVARALLEGGARVDGADPDGKTPLTWATLFNRTEVIAVLDEFGADQERLHTLARMAASLFSLTK